MTKARKIHSFALLLGVTTEGVAQVYRECTRISPCVHIELLCVDMLCYVWYAALNDIGIFDRKI